MLVRYGFELGRAARNDNAGQEAFSRALAIAKEAGDTGLELSVVTASADLDCYQLRLEESAHKSMEAIRLAKIFLRIDLDFNALGLEIDSENVF